MLLPVQAVCIILAHTNDIFCVLNARRVCREWCSTIDDLFPGLIRMPTLLVRNAKNPNTTCTYCECQPKLVNSQEIQDANGDWVHHDLCRECYDTKLPDPEVKLAYLRNKVSKLLPTDYCSRDSICQISWDDPNSLTIFHVWAVSEMRIVRFRYNVQGRYMFKLNGPYVPVRKCALCILAVHPENEWELLCDKCRTGYQYNKPRMQPLGLGIYTPFIKAKYIRCVHCNTAPVKSLYSHESGTLQPSCENCFYRPYYAEHSKKEELRGLKSYSGLIDITY